MSFTPQTRNQPAVDAGIDHITLSVGDAHARAAEFVDRYGFEVIAAGETPEFTAVAVGQRDVVLLLLEGRTDDHPATLFTARHGQTCTVPCSIRKAVEPKSPSRQMTSPFLYCRRTTDPSVQRRKACETPSNSGCRASSSAETGPGGGEVP